MLPQKCLRRSSLRDDLSTHINVLSPGHWRSKLSLTFSFLKGNLFYLSIWPLHQYPFSTSVTVSIGCGVWNVPWYRTFKCIIFHQHYWPITKDSHKIILKPVNGFYKRRERKDFYNLRMDCQKKFIYTWNVVKEPLFLLPVLGKPPVQLSQMNLNFVRIKVRVFWDQDTYMSSFAIIQTDSPCTSS